MSWQNAKHENFYFSQNSPKNIKIFFIVIYWHNFVGKNKILCRTNLFKRLTINWWKLVLIGKINIHCVLTKNKVFDIRTNNWIKKLWFFILPVFQINFRLFIGIFCRYVTNVVFLKIYNDWKASLRYGIKLKGKFFQWNFLP